MKSTARAAERAMQIYRDQERARNLARFFQTGKGEYGEGDVFMGVKVPQIRVVAREFTNLELKEVEELLHSHIHEIRSLALIILCAQYKKGGPRDRSVIMRLYCANTRYINNWDLVDVSAGRILGAWCVEHKWTTLKQFARSKSIWERRIAMIATSAYFKEKDCIPTKAIATQLLHDQHDLIHKAVGWMLREMGKCVNQNELREFLGAHAHEMPRTMLRYATERLPRQERKRWLGVDVRTKAHSRKP